LTSETKSLIANRVSHLRLGRSPYSTARTSHKVPLFSRRNFSSAQIVGHCSHKYAFPADPTKYHITCIYLQLYSHTVGLSSQTKN